MKEYIEYSFYLSFFDLIDDVDEASSLEELMKTFNINYDLAELYNQYLSYGKGTCRAGKGDVFVFLNKNDGESFILIDLFQDFTDQYNMVKLGVRCEVNFGRQIRDKIWSIHSRAEIKSKIKESNDDLLKLDICSVDYPKEIRYGNQKYLKNIYYKTF
ncbi:MULTISPECIES: hypothetical protein [Paenibacillus]|uniref:hypothetical protein n=1 Tax=Paenibacillus TaxID=44249 RepID=UPI001F2DE162|nr:hypothetical protein [Paenibacillus sp. JJ-223]CAH1203129.1 hypothetical protein PAECIP111890_02149 [Paenibacillus sp. JJ-223]